MWGARLGLRTADVIDAAAQALAEGLDGPALRLLGGLAGGDPEGRVPGLVREACAELGLPWHEPGGREANEAGARALARQVMCGRLSPRRFASLLYDAFGHDLELLDPVTGLAPEYENGFSGWSEAGLDALLRVEAWHLGADPSLFGPHRPRRVTTERELVLDFLAALAGISTALRADDPPVAHPRDLLGRRRPRTGVAGDHLYELHGYGCRFSGPDGTVVDVDFTVQGAVVFDACRLQYYGSRLPEAYVPEQDALRAAASALPQLTEVRPGWFSPVSEGEGAPSVREP